MDHHEEFTDRVKNHDNASLVPDTFDQRIRTNWAALSAVWYEFMRALGGAGVDFPTQKALYGRFLNALKDSLETHRQMIEKLGENEKRGNLSYIIKSLLEGKTIKPKDKDKFEKRNCLWMKNGDLGIEPELLLQLVRAQPGYHNATKYSVTSELKDIGALVINRNGQNTTTMVKLWKGGPWGYRIRMNVIMDTVEKYT